MNELEQKGQALADRAVAFINSLKHTKGVWYGKNFELLPWQDDIVRNIFGTLKPNGLLKKSVQDCFLSMLRLVLVQLAQDLVFILTLMKN